MSSIKKIKQILLSYSNSKKIDQNAINELSDLDKELIEKIINDNFVERTIIFLESIDTDKEWGHLQKEILGNDISKYPLWKKVYKYAALFVGFLAIFYFVNNQISLEKSQSKDSITNHDFQSNNGIKLITDSQEKLIDANNTEEVVIANGISVGIQSGNKISYTSTLDLDDLIYNELEVPFGNRVFTLELSDGTEVYLNAGTRIKYPVKFIKDNTRQVFISKGEAYFKVAKDTHHPFIVTSENVSVEVLGTEFNFSSFEEDEEISTVLVEGSVQMSFDTEKAESILLKPGFKGAWNKENKSKTVHPVDVNVFTAWINGEIVFRNSAFGNMIKKLERRYNVSFKVKNSEILEKHFNASFNVDHESIYDILTAMSKIHPFKFNIREDQVEIN
ncbi:FecR family protein [Aestuariibaculum sediminum]|uniref:FecR domain-containing protein n=1 Tax=Aestuariibaculum sediminum TaxID=2770637 RepID=A0A8J6U8I6_9FLAO|nr:FecR family protein [Aestuariibaculum sediminum]MBD0831617.1 FecR domain-containing protein [Aestuariibaculum sediminum]